MSDSVSSEAGGLGRSASSSTPTRPPRPSRTSIHTTSPTIDADAAASPLDLARRSLLAGREGAAADLLDADRTPRKAHVYGLPTPPLSETTSSASGSVGRTRKDSTEPSAPSVAGAAAASSFPSSEQLMIPRREPRAARSPSATSSRTGSDTVGARSPVEHPQGSFRTSRMGAESPAYATSRYSAGTVGRRRRSDLHSAAALDSPDRGSSSPVPSRFVQRAQSSLGVRSSFADDGQSGHRSSSNVGRSAERSVDGDTPDRSDRRRRSTMHEQDVSQIRSESRLGHSDAIEEDEETRAIHSTTAHVHKYSPRKATTLSHSRYRDDAGEGSEVSPGSGGQNLPTQSPPTQFRSVSSASTGRRQEEPQEARPATSIGSRRDYGIARKSFGSQINPEDVASTSARRRSLRAAETNDVGEALLTESSSRRKASLNRSPLPVEFRLPDKEARRAWRAAHAQEQSDSVTSDPSEGEEDRSASRQTIAGVGVEPALPVQSAYPRRRYASDAQADELPPLDYEGRLGSQGSRISVDSTSANRYLTRGPLQGTPASTRRSSRASEIGSPSEEARIRKISTSSSRSQRSSGGASELHRTASRASMRRMYGRDVFDDESLPPLPGSRSESPAVRSDATSTSDRTRSLTQRFGELKESRTGRWHELDELRTGVGELAGSGSSAPHSDSRSTSVQSHRTYSALGLQRTPIETSKSRRAPLTEPRNLRQDRSAALSDIGSSDRSERSAETEGQRAYTTYRRATVARSQASVDSPHGRTPMTPDPNGPLRLAAGSRASVVQSATLPPTARFPSGNYALAGPRIRSEGSGESGHPVHDRNMRNAFDMFERYFSAAPPAASPKHGAGGPDSLEMVTSFGEAVANASDINAGLRALISVALEAQIDAEISERNGAAVSAQMLDCFTRLDRDLTNLLKRSDDQVRNLTDGLMAVTRAERERDRQRKANTGEVHAVGARSASRMSTVASPADEVRRGIDSRSSSELRRSSSTLIREPTSPAGTIVDHGSAERKSERFRSADRVSSSNTSQRIPASPYSPLQAKANAATFGGTLTASQMRTMASTGSHSRSASEFSPQARLRRERSTFLAETVKLPALSPRRPKLSFPSVSNATASFNPAAPDEAQTVASRATAEAEAAPLNAQDESASSSLVQARMLVSEPMELGGSPPSERRVQLRSTFASAATPVSGGSGRRNTVIEKGDSTVGKLASPNGLGIEAALPAHARREESEEPKRYSRSEKPPRPPRHDLMRRDTEEEAATTADPTVSSSLNSIEGRTDDGRGSTAGLSRFGSMSRNLGRSAARRISRTFASGSQDPETRNAEETQA